MAQIPQPGFLAIPFPVKLGVGIGLRLVRVVGALVAAKLGAVSLAAVLLLKTLLAGPRFDQRAVHREVLVRQLRFGLRQHAGKERARHFLIQQPLPILAEHRVVPHRFVHLHSHEPAKQQVVAQLLHQQPLAAHRVENLQQQCAQQTFRRNRRPARFGIQPVELLAHGSENLVY